ncbi:MHYT domain-containing protein [Aureimonas psammosilenae]|uniref:hypothetical protein n=1 Tax=Aureimonas psammosilenae TaxID=2495496 RepID=UPI001260B743|nr:hypothetical protein [Aureimonas psammosilenae]
MSHLLADLTGYHDPFWGALVVLAALCGAFLLMILLRQATSFYGWRRAGLVAVGGLASTGISWGAFLAAFKSTYPQIAISIPPSHAASSLTTSLAFNLFGLSIAAAGRRSGRNVLLAGSLLSFGFSCMVFTSMSGMVSPYALSYDLSAVLLVMIFGALLASFAISEIGKKGHNNSLAIGTLLGGAAIAFSAFGSLSSILSFGDWMSAVAEPDDLTASPIVVIGAAEAVTVLVLSFVGSLATTAPPPATNSKRNGCASSPTARSRRS